MSSKFEDLLALIKEDSVDAPSTSVLPGNEMQFSSPPTNSEFTSLSDLLRYKTGMDIGSTSKKILGVPLQTILEQLADLYIKSQDAKKLFKQASENPVYSGRPELNPVFKNLDNHIVTIQTQIKLITQELDALAISSLEN
jgi:hypothetical protein